MKAWLREQGENMLVVIVLLIPVAIGFISGVLYCEKEHSKNDMFCPECGRQYQHVQYCKYDGTELKEVQK